MGIRLDGVKCAGKAIPAVVVGTAAGGPLLGVLGGARDFVACLAERDREETKMEVPDRVTCLKLGGEPTAEGCRLRDGGKEYLVYLKSA